MCNQRQEYGPRRLVRGADQRIGVEGLVADQGFGIDLLDQRLGASRIVGRSISAENGFDEQPIIGAVPPTWPSRPGRKSLIRSHWSSRNA